MGPQKEFYVDSSRKLQATKCTADVQGKPVFKTGNRGSCSDRDKFTGDCFFQPSSNQDENTASIMYSRAGGLNKFCRDSQQDTEDEGKKQAVHDPYAPFRALIITYYCSLLQGSKSAEFFWERSGAVERVLKKLVERSP